MASIMRDKEGRPIGVRAYGGIDPVTHKTRNLYLPLAPDATTEDIEREKARIQRIANFSKSEGADATIGTMLSFYVDVMEAYGESPQTVSSYRSNIRCYIDPFIGSDKLTSADAMMFTSLYFRLLTKGGKDGNPLSPNTVIKLHSWLKGAFGYFADLGLITVNPILAVKPPSFQKPDIEVLDTDDYFKLIDYLEERIESGSATALDYALYLDSGSGLRCGELAALKIKNFFPKNLDIFVEKNLAENSKKSSKKFKKSSLVLKRTKSNKSRHVYIDNKRCEALKKHVEEQREKLAEKGVKQTPYTPLFAKSDGRPYRPRSFNDYLKRIVKKLGLSPNIHAHCLRHTHATMLIERGTSFMAIQDRYGHYDISVTLGNYGHAIRDKDTKVAEDFSRYEDEMRRGHEEDQGHY